jgi:X-domain of DnaJ-containing/DnaJ domain
LIARVQNGTKALSLIFPTHKPRHVAEGAVNLARSVVTGLGLAVLSVLALPVAGYRQGGWTGLVAGGLAGTLYGALFCVVGLANGAYQVARGAYHTPAALAALRLGQVWNTETESYQTYYLHDELAQVRAESAHQHERNDRTIKDPLYYNLLSVSPTDSVQTIQKAYRAQARLVHPDKNPNDAEAAHTFQKLHTAYTILTDPEQRAAYDLWGPTLTGDDSSSSSSVPTFDPHVFYTILFSSQLVEPYVGELTVASFTKSVLQLVRATSGGSSSAAYTPEDVVKLLWRPNDWRPRQRQLEIATFLQARVQSFVALSSSSSLPLDESVVAEFRIAARTEAQRIAATPFGYDYSHAIGTALVSEAQRYLGFSGGGVEHWLSGVSVMVQQKLDSIQSLLAIVRETMDVLAFVAKEVSQDSEQNTRQPPRLEQDRLEELLPELLDVAWAYNVRDISQTLHGACTRLFADATATTRTQRLARAQAVQMLGQEFLRLANQEPIVDKTALNQLDDDDVGKSGPSAQAQRRRRRRRRRPTKNLLARVEVAFQVAVMKVGSPALFPVCAAEYGSPLFVVCNRRPVAKRHQRTRKRLFESMHETRNCAASYLNRNGN